MYMLGLVCIGLLVGLATFPIHVALVSSLVPAILMSWLTGVLVALSLVTVMWKYRDKE